jgi:hypothetical protein
MSIGASYERITITNSLHSRTHALFAIDQGVATASLDIFHRFEVNKSDDMVQINHRGRGSTALLDPRH